MSHPAEGLDEVVHQRTRLGILAVLTEAGRAQFGFLKSTLSLTDGNLSRHLQVLQEAGVVEVTKSFSRNRPQTLCRITPEGRRRFLDYLAVLDQVVREAAAAAKTQLGEDPLPGLATA